ncbi:peroxisome proliferator-activated receptor gamma coactivator-related protein 1 isoform X2 [Lampris incognitus]|uniref:peroxisome proliferator-activated receptor gamma coactivator-related protein 1 isoform X2 n=1 Tax=Lampris incognitus TaxID=2546036 RepID=UPI0024B511C2|nr:peroxisome proliferator-activated receptor gamma coactivator-related protein 1 isoform X2 [Lampris incognitus]
MASRWGVGEEILTACNMDFFATDTLDETGGLSSGETLEALQGSLDPSILSIFEDTSAGEVKGLDEESEATLLTALTEILDNVDDENLSPFDTLPDSDLLSGQKGREHSPLKRLLCLSCSPPEKEMHCRPFSAGKSLPKTQAGSVQRSDGEEEEDSSLTQSPVRQPSSPDKDLLDWEDMTLPVPLHLEQESEYEDGGSVSLGDLVRHMHPYCMAVCVEDGEEEQILPEGGILLEVVDRGEHGEPILAIPDMSLPLSLQIFQGYSEKEQRVPEKSEESISDNSEHIIVDDSENVKANEASVNDANHMSPIIRSEVKGEKVVRRIKEAIIEKSPSRRKKKKKSNKKEAQPVQQVPPVEKRVLRSISAKRAAQGAIQKPVESPVKQEKNKVKPVSLASSLPSSSPKNSTLNRCQTKNKSEVTTLTLPPEINANFKETLASRSDPLPANESLECDQPNCPPTMVNSSQPVETTKQSAPVPENLDTLTASSAPAPKAVLPLDTNLPPNTATPQQTLLATLAPKISEVSPPAPESKPRPLSLEEYRRLRQQKKPAPVEKQDDQSTKWPSLPEPPKELPPIPCLPDPSPRNARHPSHVLGKKEVVEVKVAWQPMGPGAPPTPAALLAPPAYMVASSNKAVSATQIPKPQQAATPPPTTVVLKPSKPQNSSASSPGRVKNLTPPLPTASLPAKPLEPPSIQSAVQPAPQLMPPAERTSSDASGDDAGKSRKHCSNTVSSRSAVLNEVSSKTTTESLKSTTAALPAQIPINAPQKTTVFAQIVPPPIAATSVNNPIMSASKPSKHGVTGIRTSCSEAAQHADVHHSVKSGPVLLGAQGRPTASPHPPRAKSATQELIESFTSEIGIEAADLTSLLEQFEETQAKEEHCVPEVSGRAAAVGNSSVELPPEKMALERVKAIDQSSTAALTPPATPPHQMWKPLAPVTLLGKSRVADASKPTPSKVIQIEARPLPLVRTRSKPTAAAATVSPDLAFFDHDYCLPNKELFTGEQEKRWNVKQQPSITIKAIKRPNMTTTQPLQSAPVSSLQTATIAVALKMHQSPLTEPLDHRTDGPQGSSVLETPDASPSRQETDTAPRQSSPRRGPSGSSGHRRSSSRSTSPTSSPKERKRGRSRKRRLRRSRSPTSSGSESDSCSSHSRSLSPPVKRYRPRRSSNSSSTSSRSSSRSSGSPSRSPPRKRRYSYSSSCSDSWSRSRSRSHSGSPHRGAQRSRGRHLYRSSIRHSEKQYSEEVKMRKERAIEERRVVYVGRIRGTMTRKELRERFSLFGEIEACTLHLRDQGDNYGFVTYYHTKDAFTAIESGNKLRKPDELPFDLCFGGRRQFCQTSYSDLDSNREYEPLSAKNKFRTLDFDTLLKEAQKNLKR